MLKPQAFLARPARHAVSGAWGPLQQTLIMSIVTSEGMGGVMLRAACGGQGLMSAVLGGGDCLISGARGGREWLMVAVTVLVIYLWVEQHARCLWWGTR